MSKVQPQDGAWMKEHFEYAYRPCEENVLHMSEVEEVWRGQFTIKSGVDTPELEIKQPAEGRAIITKMNQMLSIRANKGYSVARFSSSEQEQRACDRLERFLYAYENELFTRTQNDTFALAGTLMLIRGKVGLQTLYERKAQSPKVRVRIWDPAEYFPVYGDDGISWFMTEEWMCRWELLDFFGNLSEKEIEKLDNFPNLEKATDQYGREFEADLNEQVRVHQYWNEAWMAWSIEDTLVQKYEHGYGKLTLREAKLGATPFKNMRWKQEPFIGPIVDSLKLKAKLTSEAANAMEAYYAPWILTKSDNGEVMVVPTMSAIGETIPIGKDGEVIVLNPHPNQGELKVLIDLLNNDIAKTTLPDPAWSTSVGDESGFRASLTLNQIKDSVADVRNQAEMCYALVLGDVLWMHEKYAPEGGWPYAILEPNGKSRIQSVTAEDIGEHQKVTVRITPALPQDLLQMVTVRDMLTKRDEMTGMMLTSPETANDITGISDVIGDVTQDNERREWDYLLTQDPEAKDLHMRSIKAKNAARLREMEKTVEREEKKAMKRDVVRTMKDIEEGLTEDIVLPAEILADPMKLNQFVALITQQGMMPQDALNAMQEGMPLGMPGEMVAEGMAGQQPGASPEIDAVMAQLMGQQPQQPQPNGFTGYEGVNPMVAPAAMMGAMPRTALDRPALQVEAVETMERRGAKPPAR